MPAIENALEDLASGDARQAVEVLRSAGWTTSGGGDSLRAKLICMTASETYLHGFGNRAVDAVVQSARQYQFGNETRPPLRAMNAVTRLLATRLEFERGAPEVARLVELWNALIPLRDEQNSIRDGNRGTVNPGWSSNAKGEMIGEVSNDGLFAHSVGLGILFARKRGISSDELESFLPLAARLCRFYVPEIEATVDGMRLLRSRIDERVEPYNHVHPWAAACGLVGLLTEDHELVETGNAFMETFNACKRVDYETGLPFWSYRPPVVGEPPARGEQIWKAITTLSLPLTLNKIGVVSDRYIHETYARVFRKRIYTGEGRKDGRPTFQVFVGNQKRRPLERRRLPVARQPRVQHLGEWAVLGQFDSRIDDVLFDAVIRRPDLFPRGWTGHYRATVGLANIVARRPNIGQEYLVAQSVR